MLHWTSVQSSENHETDSHIHALKPRGGARRRVEAGEEVVTLVPHILSCWNPLLFGGFLSVPSAQPPPQPGAGQEEFRRCLSIEFWVSGSLGMNKARFEVVQQQELGTYGKIGRPAE